MRVARFLSKGLLALGGALVIAGCPLKLGLEIEQGSTVENLTLRVSSGSIFGGPTELPGLLVESCEASWSGGQNTYWQIDDTKNPSAVREITYGETPDGYETIVEARPLSLNGCYTISYYGAKALHFVTDSLGQIREISRSEARRWAVGSRV